MNDPRDRAGRLGYTSDVLGLSGDAFLLLRDLVAQRTGVYFEDARRDIMADKLATILAAHGLSSFLDYYYLLRYDPDSERYWSELMDRMAVPETYFWRQAEQIEALARHIAPRHFEHAGSRPLRIWSAACCTGEEPLSIAMALAEAGLLGRHPIEIFASDGSGAMIERARSGLYRDRAFRALPEAMRRRYFEPEGDAWRIDPALHARVQWRTVNLAVPAEVSPLAGADVIFCRNVFIYFSDDAIRSVAALFYERMPTPGHLFLGAAESLTRLGSSFELEELGGAFVYVKRATLAGAPTPPRREAPARRSALRQET